MTLKFGTEFAKPWSPNTRETVKLSDFGCKLLKKDFENVRRYKPLALKLIELISNSNEFPLKFPIKSCRTISQPTDRQLLIEKHAASAYPVIHESVLYLYLDYLEHKKKTGNPIEKAVYSGLTLVGFVQRLLEKRCASFCDDVDAYLLVSGERGFGGFDEIGEIDEEPPLVLKNCLSYNEVKLSALLSVSSYTDFINNGSRKNCGIVETNLQSIEREGVIIGLIGARLSRRDLMEFQDIVITTSQNTVHNGYGGRKQRVWEYRNSSIRYRKLWDNFYKEPSILFNEVGKVDPLRLGPTKNRNEFFDNLMMKKRYTISIDTLLLESEARGKVANKVTYLHVVGIGLGVWKVNENQEEIFLDTFEQRLNILLPNLQHIGFIHFSWFKLNSWGSLSNGTVIKSDSHPNSGIKIFMTNRDPSEKLSDHTGAQTLLVVSYAWDGNALPGNEFWRGMIKNSSDSAAASSTLITELHNPHINKPMVNGNNLHIATEKYGVIHLSEYLAKLKL